MQVRVLFFYVFCFVFPLPNLPEPALACVVAAPVHCDALGCIGVGFAFGRWLMALALGWGTGLLQKGANAGKRGNETSNIKPGQGTDGAVDG